MPPYVKSYGQDAIELAEMAGLSADEWQRFVITEMLGVDVAGRWVAFEAGLEVARQNGKGGVYEIRELAGLFLLGERLLIHSAHEYKTAEQALDRMEALIDGCDELRREVKAVKRSHGQEGIYLKSGQALRYFTRTASGGRGFSCDFLGLDEAMKIKHSMHAAMFPTMSARPNPQILYAGSAVDRDTMEDGVVFARVRERGIRGGDPRLAWFGWSAPFDKPDEVTSEDALNPGFWAMANPALGLRVTAEYIETEQRALSARGFAVERLGVGDWPRVGEDDGTVISVKTWLSLVDKQSAPVGRHVFVFDVSPDRSSACVSVGGIRDDGLHHVEVMEHKRGTGWLGDYLKERVEKHKPLAVMYAERSPAASLAPDFRDRGLDLVPVSETDHANAFGIFCDAVDQRTLRHLGTNELVSALKGASTRPLGDSQAWSRKNSNVDITPLVSCTLALFGALNADESAFFFEVFG